MAGFALNQLQPKNLLQLLIFPAVFEALFCLGQQFSLLPTFNHYFTVTGTWSNPNVTAMFLAMCITLAPAIGTDSNTTPKNSITKSKFFLILYILLLFTALILLQCRTALIGAAVNLLIYTFVSFGITQNLFSKKYIALKIVLAIGATVFLIPLAAHMYKAKQASADGRLLVWKISAQMVAEKPLFGFGYGSFEREYNLHQGNYFKNGKGTATELENAGHVKMAYNEFLENTVEGGAVGLVLLAGLLATLLVRGYRSLIVERFNGLKDKGNGRGAKQSILAKHENNNKNTPQIIDFAGICTFTVMSLFNFTVQAIPVMCVFVIYGAMLNYKPQEESLPRTETATNKTFKNIYALSLIALALFFLVHQSVYCNAHLQLKQAIGKYYQNDKTQRAILKSIGRYLKKSDNYHKWYAEILKREGYINEALLQYNLALGLTSDPDVFLKRAQCHWQLNHLTQAEHDLQQALYIQPGLFEPRYALMNLYLRTGNTLKAGEMAKGIISMKPKIPSKQITFYKQKAKQYVAQNQ